MLVEMFWNEHPPPHFHVSYGEYRAIVLISTGELDHGRLPSGARRDIKAWTLRHQDELMANWERAREKAPLWPVKGADEDD